MNPDFVNLTLHFSPELVKPHPEAAPRKQRKNQTRRRKAAIVTDTPEKQALEKESQIKELKKRKNAAGCERKLQPEKVTKQKGVLKWNSRQIILKCFVWCVRKHMPTANQESNGYNAWTVEIGPILIVQKFQQMKSIIFVTAVCQIKQRH